MKVIAEFVDIRNGNRYGPGDWDKIDPGLDDDQIKRLKKAGALSDGAEVKASASMPAACTEMRTEAGEVAARDADAQARARHQKTVEKDTSASSSGGGDDGVAGRSKQRHK
jgi:hypothetical protein